eukprot:13219686-Ditylum_brightwellii.AAC.1
MMLSLEEGAVMKSSSSHSILKHSKNNVKADCKNNDRKQYISTEKTKNPICVDDHLVGEKGGSTLSSPVTRRISQKSPKDTESWINRDKSLFWGMQSITETATQATRMDCPSSLKGDALSLSTSTKLKKRRGKKSQSDDASKMLHSAVVLSPVSKTAKQKRKSPQKNAQPSVRSEDTSSAAISPQCTDSPLTSVHPQHDM